MANEEDLELTGNARSGSRFNLKWLLKVGALLLVVGCSIGGTVFYFKMSENLPVSMDGDGDDLEIKRGSGKAIYYGLKPSFITTFEANNRQRYFQVDVTLVTRQEEMLEPIIIHQPLIRNKLVMLFASQDYLELQTDAGRRRLRKAATEAVRAIMKREVDDPAIESVIFSQFVMQ